MEDDWSAAYSALSVTSLPSTLSYSASSMPTSSNSSSMMVTFWPFGAANEFKWSGCSPTGSSSS